MTNDTNTNRQGHGNLFSSLCRARRAVAHQAVKVHSDVSGFGGGVGERDRAVEGYSGFVDATQLHQQRAAHTEVMEIVRKTRAERFEYLKRRLRPAYFRNRDGAV